VIACPSEFFQAIVYVSSNSLQISNMELELQRVDYTSLNVALQNSLKLLPGPAYKQQQKVVGILFNF
jgi:hypothetical protein